MPRSGDFWADTSFAIVGRVAWTVLFHPDAEDERRVLPARERVALDNAVEKLKEIGPTLGYPHTSDVRGADDIRELRPRQGRSAWRAFYREIGGTIVVGPSDPRLKASPGHLTKRFVRPRRGSAMLRRHDEALPDEDHRPGS